jgi:spore maturation protein CgeB
MNYKVLLITQFGKPWNNGWYYKAGLEQNGHDVTIFDPLTEEDPADKVLKVTGEFGPDYIVHTKGELPPDVFQYLRKYAKVIQWYPDPLVPDWLIPYVRAADYFFTMSEGLVEEFRKFNPNVYWLSQGFEPGFFEINSITPEDKNLYSSDVAFVGNLGSEERYLDRRNCLQEIVKMDLQFKWWGPRLPRKISSIPLLLGKIGRTYGGKFVWGEDYAKVAQLSKIFIAFDSSPDQRKSMSARMYTAVGCGAFYMCQYIDGIEDVLIPGKEIVTFRTGDEMRELIHYYLNHEEERRAIANAGMRRVWKDHTYDKRIKEMFSMIEDVHK